MDLGGYVRIRMRACSKILKKVRQLKEPDPTPFAGHVGYCDSEEG